MESQISSSFRIGDRAVGLNEPTYFIADIAANHDGDLHRAKDLIYLAAEAGSDAAKFQHFTAMTIVSDRGFRDLGGELSHQASWKKSVFEVYQDASINPDWTPILKETCEDAGIAFFTSPYSFKLVDEVDPYVLAYKVGSGDITWTDIIEYMAKKGKPVLIATGASTMDDVSRAVLAALRITPDVCVMQCNTNYTGRAENFAHIHLKVIDTFREMFPGIILGLSDHTPGHATVLGGITLGARIVEKHFTDDCSREGPDHGFSMDPFSWREMVERSRDLELALGSSVKDIADNEADTVVVQRRGIRAARGIPAGQLITANDLEVLRPCPEDGIPPYRLNEVVGAMAVQAIPKGVHVRWTDLK